MGYSEASTCLVWQATDEELRGVGIDPATLKKNTEGVQKIDAKASQTLWCQLA